MHGFSPLLPSLSSTHLLKFIPLFLLSHTHRFILLIPSVAHNHHFIVLLTTSYSLSSFSTHLCQNLFSFNSSGHHSSPKHSPFSTKITSQTLPISNTTCPAKHLDMIRKSSASMRTSNIVMVSRKY